MWTVVFIAPNRHFAENLKDTLLEEGVLVTLRSLGSSDNDNASVEVLVPESEAEEAHEIINHSLNLN